MNLDHDSNDPPQEQFMKGLLRFGLGALFVVATILVWRVFLVATWWAGKDLVWTAPPGCMPTSGTWARAWAILLGQDECARLHWAVGLLLVALALWTTMRTFFPPTYPPERYSLPDREEHAHRQGSAES